MPAYLENKLKSEIKIDDNQYNFLFTLQALPNILLPIFAGIITKIYGECAFLIITTSFILIGNFLWTFGVFSY